MTEITHKAAPSRAIGWFDPRARDVSGWAFILNRVTALGLTFYLTLHLIVLGQLAKGPEGYDAFIALMKNPIAIFGELLVVAAALFHGLNGIRIILTSFGIWVPYQKRLWFILMAIAVIVILVFAVRMFTA